MRGASGRYSSGASLLSKRTILDCSLQTCTRWIVVGELGEEGYEEEENASPGDSAWTRRDVRWIVGDYCRIFDDLMVLFWASRSLKCKGILRHGKEYWGNSWLPDSNLTNVSNNRREGVFLVFGNVCSAESWGDSHLKRQWTGFSPNMVSVKLHLSKPWQNPFW